MFHSREHDSEQHHKALISLLIREFYSGNFPESKEHYSKGNFHFSNRLSEQNKRNGESSFYEQFVDTRSASVSTWL